MATVTDKKRIIKYLNRDFSSLKQDLIENLRIYFPDTINDFSEASSTIMLAELAAFIGDNFSFYLDKKFNESFIDTAVEVKNVLKHAKQLGFKSFGKSAANGKIDTFLKVPAISINEQIVPDMRYAGIIRKGAKLKNSAGQTYETLDNIDFSKVDISNPLFFTVADRDPTTGNPINFVIKAIDIPIIAGETKTKTITVGAYEAFKKITINENDISQIISVIDSEQNEWFEVDYLAQDTVFKSSVNSNFDSADVPNVLTLKSVPHRFITEFDIESNTMSLIFGTGDAQTFDGDLIPDLGDLSLPLFGKDTFTDFSLDPQNFLKTRTLGLSPVNTTLTIKYRVGGGKNTNAGTGTIKNVSESVFDLANSDLNSVTISDVGNSFSVFNSSAVQGGKDELSIDEIRSLVSANFSAQSRMITAEDFITRVLSIPSRFGSVFRASPNPGQINRNSVELVILSKNSNGNVSIAPSSLKDNLKIYLSRFRSVTEAIEILDGEIINISLRFGILANPDFNRSEIATNCIAALTDYFNIDRWQINQPLNLTSIHSLLASISGVLSVTDLVVENKVGTIEGRTYSNTVYNIAQNTRNNIVYCRSNAIFECKYPAKDLSVIVK